MAHCCIQCREPLPSQTKQICCARCIMDPPPFDKTYALSTYKQPMIHLILGLKFKEQLQVAQALAYLLALKIKKTWYHKQQLPNVIVPMPLHLSRLRTRGFNQTIEIGRPLSRLLQIPLDYDGTRRTKETASQMQLSWHQRKRNVHGAFTAIRSYKNQRVALLDDVMTTGSTLHACASALKKAHAAHVDVWCVAKQILD